MFSSPLCIQKNVFQHILHSAHQSHCGTLTRGACKGWQSVKKVPTACKAAQVLGGTAVTLDYAHGSKPCRLISPDLHSTVISGEVWTKLSWRQNRESLWCSEAACSHVSSFWHWRQEHTGGVCFFCSASWWSLILEILLKASFSCMLSVLEMHQLLREAPVRSLSTV